MKLLQLLVVFLLCTSAAKAQGVFPGLEKIMTEAEWKRAGLEKLTPDQIGVIDAALIRHYARSLPASRTIVASAPVLAPTPAPAPSSAGVAAPTTASTRASISAPAAVSTPPAVIAPEPAPASREPSKSLWDRFGLPAWGGDWRDQPPLVAKFKMWQGANRFLLDNGQVWEGVEQIVFELPPGRDVIIEARPNGAFAMKLDERSAVVRVRRVK